MYLISISKQTIGSFLEKPYGDNIMNFFPDAPYHLIALIPAAYVSHFLHTCHTLKEPNAKRLKTNSS